MEVSKLTLREETRKQKHLSTHILLWMQENKKLCMHTTVPRMARSMSMTIPGTFDSLRQTIIRMINNRMLFRTGNRLNSSFSINYMHINIPQEVIEKAPKEDKEIVERILAKVDESHKLDEEGCIVTHNNINKSNKTNTTKQEIKPVKEEQPKVEISTETKQETEVVSSDMSEENTTIIPTKVEVDKNGTSISITINLNINK